MVQNKWQSYPNCSPLQVLPIFYSNWLRVLPTTRMSHASPPPQHHHWKYYFLRPDLLHLPTSALCLPGAKRYIGTVIWTSDVGVQSDGDAWCKGALCWGHLMKGEKWWDHSDRHTLCKNLIGTPDVRWHCNEGLGIKDVQWPHIFYLSHSTNMILPLLE